MENESDVKDFDKWKLDALGKIETREYFRKILEKDFLTLKDYLTVLAQIIHFGIIKKLPGKEIMVY